eukprot:gene8479-biopygen10651
MERSEPGLSRNTTFGRVSGWVGAPRIRHPKGDSPWYPSSSRPPLWGALLGALLKCSPPCWDSLADAKEHCAAWSACGGFWTDDNIRTGKFMARGTGEMGIVVIGAEYTNGRHFLKPTALTSCAV